jgi:diguanylate cyclase (GGDEF)-like protein/PAS domain S-box-containing protein
MDLSVDTEIDLSKKFSELSEEKDYYKTAFNILADLVWLKDLNGVFLKCNKAVTQMVGLSESEILGKTDYDLFDKERADFFRTNDLEVTNRDKTITNLEYLSAADGSMQGYFETTKTPMKDKNGKIIGSLGVSRNVNDAVLKERELEKLSKFDNLTGLKNRRTFIDIFSKVLVDEETKQNSHALLFIDLDRFKEINDTMGHIIGDKILMMVSQRLTEQKKENTILARFGGDEFTFLIKNITSEKEASDTAYNIVKTLRKPFTIDDYEFYITSSVGISIFPKDADTVENLLKYADSAMYDAKNRGKDNYRFYTEELLENNLKKLSTINNLRKAIKNQEFELYYQAQIDPRDKTLKSAEALIRWNHPTKGIISPNDFISIAEDSGQIIEIGKWVMIQAMKDIVNWKENSYAIGRVSINLSVKQLNDKNLLKIINDALKKTKCKPGWIEFEITESYAMSDPECSIILLQKISDLGITLSLDDFGTGYSSLAYLKKLPINKLKIDRSFVRDILVDNNDEIIVNTIILMAKSMNLDVIAEGVETQEQQNILLKNQCNLTQGYLYSIPTNKEKFNIEFFN